MGCPLAETHAAMLPHTIGFNAGAAGGLLDPVREIFGLRNHMREFRDLIAGLLTA